VVEQAASTDLWEECPDKKPDGKIQEKVDCWTLMDQVRVQKSYCKMAKHGFKCIATTRKACFWQCPKDPTESVTRYTFEDAKDGRHLLDELELREPKGKEEWLKMWGDLIHE
jgi:hypothetical protein